MLNGGSTYIRMCKQKRIASNDESKCSSTRGYE